MFAQAKSSASLSYKRPFLILVLFFFLGCFACVSFWACPWIEMLLDIPKFPITKLYPSMDVRENWIFLITVKSFSRSPWKGTAPSYSIFLTFRLGSHLWNWVHCASSGLFQLRIQPKIWAEIGHETVNGDAADSCCEPEHAAVWTQP